METGKISVKDALVSQGTVIYPIKGVSMLPMLEEGKDMVSLSRVDSDTALNINDVVLFERNTGALILHRITKINKKKFEITGDNCTAGETVKRNQILGIMTGFYKGTQYVSASDPDYIKYVSEKTADFEHRTIIKPMHPEWKQLIKLVFYAISGDRKAEIPADADWNALLTLSRKHFVTATAFRAIDKSACPSDVYEKWQRFAQKTLQRTILYDNERQNIYNKFRENGIRYVPLKGILISKLYPEYGIREFSDNDILIDRDRIDDTVPFMKEMGYECHIGGAHYAYYKDDLYSYEIHKSLFAPFQDFHEFFDGVTERIVPFGDDPYEFRMTDEDFYLHILAHFYKHFDNGGAGLRSFADLWLIKEDYRARGISVDVKKLKKLGLYDFDREIDALVRKMFLETDSLTYEDISYIMTSGVYGTAAHSIERGIRKNGKFKFALIRFFPPYLSMKETYPILGKLPFLLPFCWIVRLVRCCFKPNAKSYLKSFVKAYKKKDVDEE